MNNITQQRINHILNKKMNYPEGIMTRREWLDLKISQGWSSKCEISTPAKQGEFDRTKFNRMDREAQIKYEKRMDSEQLYYSLVTDKGTFFELTKTEYDYIQSIVN